MMPDDPSVFDCGLENPSEAAPEAARDLLQDCPGHAQIFQVKMVPALASEQRSQILQERNPARLYQKMRVPEVGHQVHLHPLKILQQVTCMVRSSVFRFRQCW